MNPVKGNKSALWALAAAGGLWAWRNRDKIQDWVNTQRSQMSGQFGGQLSGQTDDQAATGPTRRIGSNGYDSPSPRIYDEPLDRQV